MEFDPNNPVVKLCIQGMAMEGNHEQAGNIFLEAWHAATNDFEKYLAAWYVSACQKKIDQKLQWLQTALALALKLNSPAVTAAIPLLHTAIAACFEQTGDSLRAKEHRQLSASFPQHRSEAGPFYHGTRADLQTGDLLTPGNQSNYQAELVMNHIYFTALINGAGLAAALAKGDGPERVYIVEPTGSFENDPNVTNKKFPGNPTRSYRTQFPLKITGEATGWARQTPEQIQGWRERLAGNKGSIIN